jgi:hypothetical protein
MDLRTVIRNTLSAERVMRFDQVVKAVAEKLEPDIRQALNELARNGEIRRHVGGRDHPWTYQALPIKPRKILRASKSGRL